MHPIAILQILAFAKQQPCSVFSETLVLQSLLTVGLSEGTLNSLHPNRGLVCANFVWVF